MRIGITAWGNIVSPAFDSARRLLVFDTESGEIRQRQEITLYPGFPFQQVEALRRAGVEVLICGAVSEVPGNMIEGAGIRLIPFITGNIDEVIRAFLDYRLPAADFMMPGCGKRRRRRRRGRRI